MTRGKIREILKRGSTCRCDIPDAACDEILALLDANADANERAAFELGYKACESGDNIQMAFKKAFGS